MYKIFNINNYNFFIKKINHLWAKYKFSFKKKIFTVYEGPPSMNGTPCVHHLLSKIIKDICVRYKSMKSFFIKRLLGWDAHGLPIELEIQNKLNINKNVIKKSIGINKFNYLCNKFVYKNIKIWKKFTYKLGFFNQNNKKTYYTCSSNYIESVWYIIYYIYKKGLIYKDYKVQPYSVLAGTVISNNELNFPNAYKVIKEKSIIFLVQLQKKYTFIIKKKLINKKIYLLVWSTTPWTIPANSAIAINKKYNYFLIKTFNPFNYKKIFVILVENMLLNIFNNFFFFKKNNHFKKKIPYYIIKKIKGKKLINLKYLQIIKWIKIKKNKLKIYNADFVTDKEGTGIVHISPTFGINDNLLSIKKKIPSIMYKYKQKKISIVNNKGKYIKFLPIKFRNRYIDKSFIKNNNKKKKYLSLNDDIINFLIKKNKIFKIFYIKHKYPYCWRTNCKILFLPQKSWFINTNKIKLILINNIKNVKWINNIGKKKFIYWINNNINWNFTRSRYWGTPLPIWKSKDNKIIKIIYSKTKILNKIKKKKINLHNNILNKIFFFYKNKKIYKEKYVVDVWFDSGCMPFAQFHYPFENKNYIINNLYYPADFVCEGIDQIRGWFFTLYVISILLFKKPPYKKILVTGMLLDKYGKKMSKSKNNALNAFDILNKYGPDIIRFYFIFNNKPWYNIKFDEKKINIIKKKFFNTLINVCNFFLIYFKIDNIKISNINFKYLNFIDKWLISLLNTLIIKVNYYYKKYNYYKVSKILYNFIINDLSNWYIRLNRFLFWKKKKNIKKINIYNILYLNIKIFLKLCYPILPYISEFLFINIFKKKKILFISKFPKYNIKYISNNVEYIMKVVKKICSMIFSLRKKNNLKIRLPLKSVNILLKINNNFFSFIKEKNIKYIIKKETNIKNVFFLKKNNKIFKKKILPNYKYLGPKYKNNINNILNIIKTFSKKEIKKLIKKKKIIKYFKKRKYFFLKKEFKFILINYKNNVYKHIIFLKNNYCMNIYLCLNIKINSKLKEEGYVRDLIQKIQNIRKLNNILIINKINLMIYCKPKQKIIIIKYLKYLSKEVLLKKIFFKKYIFLKIVVSL